MRVSWASTLWTIHEMSHMAAKEFFSRLDVRLGFSHLLPKRIRSIACGITE